MLPVESTEEFKVLSNNMSAEFGRTGGGIISVISKSGTNQYHGSLFEYLRNTALNSNEFFANKAGVPVQPLVLNQFGGSVAGLEGQAIAAVEGERAVGHADGHFHGVAACVGVADARQGRRIAPRALVGRALHDGQHR